MTPRHQVLVGTAVILLAAGWLVLAAPASGAGDPDAAKGIVVEHCIACHEVPPYSRDERPESIDAQPFKTIADNPEVYTRDRLRAFLHRPHFPMGKFILSGRDIENLIAFIESMRGG